MSTPWTIDVGDLIERVAWTTVQMFFGQLTADGLTLAFTGDSLLSLSRIFFNTLCGAIVAVGTIVARQRLEQLGPIE